MTASYPLQLTSVAEQDLLEAIAWYDDQQLGLGDEFLRTVDATLANIARDPFHYQQPHHSIRRGLVPRFPYGIFYRIAVSQILRMLANGDYIDELLREYPSLEREDIYAALQYAADLTEEHVTPLDATNCV